MSENGVIVINGTSDSASSSRLQSPTTKTDVVSKPKKFQNGWSREQERLMAEWSDIGSCYRWLHDKSEKTFHTKTLWINLPVIILSTLGGTANFGIQSLFENDENAKKYASFAIGGISLFAGLLTTVGNYLRYAQLEESHRVAAITWGKFQRLLAVELALNPNDRMDSLDFLKICRAELDRLIEQSPPIPKESIELFEKKFGTIKELKKPDVCGALEHTMVFESSETRLRMMASEAALMLKHKKRTLNELITPEMEKKVAEQVEARLAEAIESRKKNLEDEIDKKRQDEIREKEDREQALAERRKKIEEEIELEKKKMYGSQDKSVNATNVFGSSQFESRLNYRSSSNVRSRSQPRPQSVAHSSIYSFDNAVVKSINKNTIENPDNKPAEKDGNIIIISKE